MNERLNRILTSIFFSCALPWARQAEGQVVSPDPASVAAGAASLGNAASGESSGTSIALSADGRFAAFVSQASNLVSGDANNFKDVFLRDRQTGVNTRVSVGPRSIEANGPSGISGVSQRGLSMSGDGRYVAFQSLASNLAQSESNTFSDIYIFDAQAGSSVRMSLTSQGGDPTNDCGNPTISLDGSAVSFSTAASNMLPGDSNASQDIFVRTFDDGGPGQLSAASMANGSNTNFGNSGSFDAVMNDNGRIVAFVSSASNLVSGDTNSTDDIFLRDLASSVTSRVSVASDGTQANGRSERPALAFSADGSRRLVAFVSSASNLVPGDTNNARDVFVRDVATGITERISVNSLEAEGNGDSGLGGVSISADGRFVSFRSNATNLVPTDKNGLSDIFVRDRLSGFTGLVSKSAKNVQSNAEPGFFALSASGNAVIFDTAASTLAAGDTNSASDVFVTGFKSFPEPLARGAVLDGSPGVVPEARAATIVMEEFFMVPQARAVVSEPAKRRPRQVLNYNITVTNAAGLSRRKTAKRNQFTFKNLPPGQYRASYNVRLKRGTRTVLRLKESPSANFTIN